MKISDPERGKVVPIDRARSQREAMRAAHARKPVVVPLCDQRDELRALWIGIIGTSAGQHGVIAPAAFVISLAEAVAAVLPIEARPTNAGRYRAPQPKQPPARSRSYLAFVRLHACANPGCRLPGPSEADHFGRRGLGQKTDDFRTVPLCAECHRARTDTNRLPGLSIEATRLCMVEAQVALLVEWAATGAGDDDGADSDTL